MRSNPRPAVVFHYEIAGRVLSVNLPDAETADSADRYLSLLRASRAADCRGLANAATLALLRQESKIPNELTCAFTSEEAGQPASYYSGNGSYAVRIGRSTVFADAESVVTIGLAENLDCKSFLFERVFTHGLTSALRRAGAFELHCAAVTDPHSGVSALIIGPSGSGKSTLALQLAASGWNFSSDDVVLLTKSEDRIEAFGLRNHFALTSETIIQSGLPGLDSVMLGKGIGADGKLPLPAQDFFPARQIQKCVPELLIFGRRTGAPQSRVNRLDQSQMMQRLLRICPWACLDRPMAKGFVDVLSRLCRQCRAFELHSGTDLLGDQHYTASFLSSIVNHQAA